MDDIPVYKLSPKGAPIRGKVNLLLAGFKRQSVISVDEVLRAIDVLPAFHLEKLRSIEYDPIWNVGDELDYYESRSSLAAAGKYVLADKTILMHKFINKPLFYRMLYHEIGHYVFYNAIGGDLKKEWVTRLYPGNPYITQYASRNGSEDFAECYASYILEPGKLMHIIEKFSFMKHQVFKRFMPDTSVL